MNGIILFELTAVLLAVFGALATLFGADSREGIEDTHQAHDAAGSR